ncbi:MucR family transcriptional regulator [Bosea sp. BK604]|uniref:MucR family transcriptional regulator n=1 Tax=Bosea sp. BK604 TaxID=2512180 RepID=UPI00104D49FC|nr:MucR family transcriptional regulator [Bosea sp. BK604]TCR68231.1 MucR family transcriptional regulator [Bosea sp. BK604]
MSVNTTDLVNRSADIVTAYVGSNNVPASELAGLIANVYSALRSLGTVTLTPIAQELVPAVPVKKSITADFIICLEDGMKFKSLKRHLRTSYDMTPVQYREKWNLPPDYPMVAPNYAEARSNLAKAMQLGQKRRKTARKAKAA